MISIVNSLNDLEKSERERAVAADCYVAAIRSAAQYAVEVDEAVTGPYRKHLEALAAEVGARGSEFLAASRGTFRALLRDYRDKAGQYLSGLRAELAGTAGALQEILNSLCRLDGDHERRLRGELNRLRSIPPMEPAAMRQTVQSAADAIEQTLNELRKQHQLTISQFQVEIRTLHKRIDELECAVAVDSLRDLLTRGGLERRIREAPAAGECLLLVRGNGLCESAASGELTAAFAKRLRNILPAEAAVGQWGPGEFVALLGLPKSEAITRGKKIAAQLSGTYSCIQDGKAVRRSIQVNVAVLESLGQAPQRMLEVARAFLAGA
jgi:hypothetical protein